MKNAKEMLDVKELKRKKLEELKVLCKNLGLKYSGNKPVLLGRLIAYYTSGSADGANKRSVEDLYGVFQDYLGTKRKKSAHIQELERDKTKSKYNYAIKGERTDFRRYLELVFGLPEVIPSVNFIGESLRTEYDGQTKEQFTTALMTCQHKLLAAAFSAHRYFTEDLIPSMHFPTLAVLVIRETNITDLGIESLLYECPKLRVLDIALTQIRGEGLRDISTKCPLLESIEIYHPLDLTIGLPHLSKCPLIHTLAGVECYDFDDEIISMLVTMPNLVNCRVTYSLFDRPSKITLKGISMLRKKAGFERIDFPADLLLDSISDPATENEPTSTQTTTNNNNLSSSSSSTPTSTDHGVVVKASPPSSPFEYAPPPSVVTTDAVPQFQIRKSILAPKEIKVFDPVGFVSFNTFRRALRLIPALTALDLCAPTCQVEKVDNVVLLLAESPHASRITRLGLAQQTELTDQAVLALRSLTGLRELNLSFCVSHHQYSQLYPQHLLQPSPLVGWGGMSSTPSLQASIVPPRQSTSTSTSTSTPILPQSPQPNIQRVQQVPTSPTLPLSPATASSSSPLTTQQLLQQRLQQRIQQRAEMGAAHDASGLIPTPSDPVDLRISKLGNPSTTNGTETVNGNSEKSEQETKPTPVTEEPKPQVPKSESEPTGKTENATNGEPVGAGLTNNTANGERAENSSQKEDIEMSEREKESSPATQSTAASSSTSAPSLVISIPPTSPPTLTIIPPTTPSTPTPPATLTPSTPTQASTTPATPTQAPVTPNLSVVPTSPVFQQPLVTADAILAVCSSWPFLETLYLDGIPFTPRLVNQILYNCKTVRTVSLNACGTALDNLLNGMPPNCEFQEFQRMGLRILHTKKK